jgi:heat shock protein HslJ
MKVIAALFTLAILVACASHARVDRDGAWELAALPGAPEGAPRPQLTIDDVEISGFAGCNRFFAQIESDPNVAAFFRGSVGATRMYCQGAPMVMERAFLEALERTGDARIVGGELVFFDTQSQEIMRFRRVHR